MSADKPNEPLKTPTGQKGDDDKQRKEAEEQPQISGAAAKSRPSSTTSSDNGFFPPAEKLRHLESNVLPKEHSPSPLGTPKNVSGTAVDPFWGNVPAFNFPAEMDVPHVEVSDSQPLKAPTGQKGDDDKRRKEAEEQPQIGGAAAKSARSSTTSSSDNGIFPSPEKLRRLESNVMPKEHSPSPLVTPENISGTGVDPFWGNVPSFKFPLEEDVPHVEPRQEMQQGATDRPGPALVIPQMTADDSQLLALHRSRAIMQREVHILQGLWKQRMSALMGQQQAAGPGPLVGQQPEAGPLVQVIQAMQPEHIRQFLQPGELVDTKYKVIRQIGRGGAFGQVYEGVEIANTRPVAIRAIAGLHWTKALLENRVLVAFRDTEWDPANQRHHPCFYDYFTWIKPAPLTHFQIVMQLLGRTLHTIRMDCPQLPRRLTIPTIYGVMVQCILAIQELHELGFIHRDIKPHNFAVGKAGNHHVVYLFDYTLCRRYRDAQGNIIPARLNLAFKGTPRYASREAQMRREQYRRHDMISLFHSFWEMLTGWLPWGTENNDETYNYKRVCRPGFLLVMRPEIRTFVGYIDPMTNVDRPMYEAMCDRFKDLLESTIGTRNENEVEYEWLQPNSCANFDHWVVPPKFVQDQTAAGLLPQAAGQFPQAAGQFPQAAGQVPQAAGQFPQGAGQFPPAAGQFPQMAAQFPQMGPVPRGPPAKIPEPRLQPPGPSGI